MNTSIPKKPLSRTALLASLFLAGIILITELLARTEFAQKLFPYRSFGNSHQQLEIKWFRLQEYITENKGLDAILLGSSQVNTGVDPNVVANTYHEITGGDLRVFNFGLDGLTVAPNALVADLLVEKYHPALLIYVTDMRDYVAGNGLGPERLLLADPWFHYQRGNPDAIGWLVDHSLALQRYLPYRRWMQAGYYEEILIYRRRSIRISPSGYDPDYAIDWKAGELPDPSNLMDFIQFEAFGNYQIAPSRLGNLQSMLNLGQEENVAVMIVEMPVHPTFYAYVGGDDVHEQFQQVISTFVSSHGGFFIPAETCNNIPLNGRSNRWHLNYLGAPAFSECIGEQIALYVEQENIDFADTDRGISK